MTRERDRADARGDGDGDQESPKPRCKSHGRRQSLGAYGVPRAYLFG